MKLNKEKIAFTGTIDAFLENALLIDDETLENDIMVENTIEDAMREFKMTRAEVIDLIESLHLEEVKRNLDQLIEKGMVEIMRYDENGDAIYGLTEKGKKFRESN
jgi:predicted transcriptional regulator